ncbi:MAG TPA: O-antigen ligase family protein [Ignavibacteriales bacterium]|nr:O-antigen ligase family protein [Ignavibacteriales bacterium]
MMENKASVIKILDRVIFICAILFLVSTNNSIFVNQLGYYGALLCILIEYFLGENRFKKTGLELAFLLFIGIEAVSAFFSFNERQAFSNVLRRFLLIPTVYTILAAADDFNKAKLFFKIYFGAALLTITFYLGFALKYFLSNLYSVQGKGPSLFQYVMTAGGLISFTTVFAFTFFINENKGLKLKMFYLAAFLVSSVALLASDTRAAWIGTAAAVFLVLILKKKWLMLAPLALIAVALVVFQNNKSIVHVYSFNKGNLVKDSDILTKGRAAVSIKEDNSLFVSDYDKGILKFKNLSLSEKYPTPFPVERFAYWKDSFYVARLLDKRLLLYRKESGKMKFRKEFISPGNLWDFTIANGHVYLADMDSGLTVLSDPRDLSKKNRYPEFGRSKGVSADSTAIALFHDDNILSVYTLKDGLPQKSIYNRAINSEYGYPQVIGDHLFFAEKHALKLFHIESDSLSLIDSNKALKGMWMYTLNDGRLFASDYNGSLYELGYPVKDKITVKSVNKLPYVPYSMLFSGGKIFISEVKRSRIGTIVDPYHPSNVERLNLWRAGIQVVKDHPLVGVGDIDMQNVYKMYRKYYDKETYGHFHNNYVHFLAALGIPGFIIVMFLIISILLTHIKIYKAMQTAEFASSYALGALAAFVGFLGSGLAEWNFGDHEIITMVWFTLGLNLAFYFSYKRKTSKDEAGKIEETVLNPKQL